MHSQIETKKVFVARNCARTSILTASNLYTTIGAGEVVVLSDTGKLIKTIAEAKAAKAIRLVQGITGGGYYISDLIEKGKVASFKGFKFSQSEEQRVVLGYNGTSGSIAVFDDNVYSVTLEYDNVGNAVCEESKLHKLAYRSPFTAANQWDIANGIAEQYATIIENSRFLSMKVNVISNETGAGSLTGCEVIKGSKAISYTGGTPAVGDVIKVPGLTGTPYRDEFASIYKVEYVDTVNKVVTINIPYQNANQSAIAITKIADLTTGNYGIVFEGVLFPFEFRNGDYVKAFAHVQREGFGITTFTNGGTGFEMLIGNGRHEPVSVEEFYYQGSVRSTDNDRNYSSYVQETQTGHGYSSVNIKFHSHDRINILESNGAIKEVVVFVDRGTYADIKANAAGTALGTNIIEGTGADTVGTIGSFLNILNTFMVASEVIATGTNITNNEGKSLTCSGVFNSGIDL